MANTLNEVANGTNQQVDITAKGTGDIDHGKLIRWVNDSDTTTQQTRANSERARDYYDSKQWTDSEIAKLKKQKQAATVINRIKPKMDALMGMEKTAKTTAKAFPRTPKHEDAAEAATEAIRFVLQDNAFDQTRSACWENILIEGTCGAEIIVKPAKDSGYKIVINHLMWDRLIYDPHSRRKDFSDARFLGQVVWMDYDEAVAKYPDAESVLQTMQAGSATYDDKPRWMDNTRRRVKIVEMYYRKPDGVMWYACFTLGGYCEEPKKSPYINEEGETEWPYEFASPFVDRDGGRYGAVLQLMDVQDEINKRRSKALHLMSVRQVRWERGAVEDINKARQELAKPDGVIETTPGMEFEVLKTGDMAAAQFNLLTEAKQEIDAVGANAAVMGKDKSVQSGVALRTREAAGRTEIGPLFDTLRYWQSRMFRKVYNRIRQYWKEELWIRVTDDEQNLRWVGLNKPITRGEQMMQQAQEQGAPPEALQQMQQQIAQDPMMQEVVDTQNDMSDLDVDIIVDEVPDVLTSQIEDFQVLGEMVKSGFQMPPLAVIEASPLSNKAKIIKMMKEDAPPSQKVQQQMQQMQEQGQKMQEELQKMGQENQSLKQGQQETAAKLQARAQEAQAEIQLKQQIQASEIQLERERAQASIALEREKAAAKISLDREVAGAQLELEQMKMQLTGDTTCDQAISKVNSLVAMHQTKMQGMLDMSAAKKEAKDAATESAATEQDDGAMMSQMRGMHEQFLAAVGQIVETLAQKKTINLVRTDGQVSGATVQ